MRGGTITNWKNGAIYAIGTNGIIFEEDDWVIMGSGSSYLLGYLDSQLGESSVDGTSRRRRERRYMTEEEAVSFGTRYVWRWTGTAARGGTCGCT